MEKGGEWSDGWAWRRGGSGLMDGHGEGGSGLMDGHGEGGGSGLMDGHF